MNSDEEALPPLPLEVSPLAWQTVLKTAKGNSNAGSTPVASAQKEIMRNNLFMTFRYRAGHRDPQSFGYIISQKAFDTFIGSNQPTGTRLVEEDVEFPEFLMSGSTRRALVHYLDGKKFACYVPVFPTEAEMEDYDRAFGR